MATVTGLIAVFAGLALSNAFTTSATVDEPIHLVAGYSYLTDRDFRLNPEHPPLVKILAAVPALASDAWPRSYANPEAPHANSAAREARLHWSVGLIDRTAQLRLAQLFLYGFADEALRREGVGRSELMPADHRYAETDFINDADVLIRAGRLVALLFGVALAAVVYLWTRKLWGFWGGIIALALFTFDPNFIAHSALVTTDVAAAAGFFATIYALWEWSRRPTLLRAVLVGLSLGIAFLSKFSTVLLIPIVVILVGVNFLRTRRLSDAALLLAVSGTVSVALVWGGYTFRYSAAADRGEARAAELATMDAVASGAVQMAIPRRRFSEPGDFATEEVVRWEAAQRDVLASGAPYHPALVSRQYAVAQPGPVGDITLLALRFRLLPEAYLYGFATARQMSLARQTFLRGEYAVNGFRTYFLWTALLKLPVIILASVLAGVAVAWRFRRSREFAILALIVPVAVIGIVLIESPLNIGHRHSLPIYPFLFVLSGSLATLLDSRRSRVIAAGAAALLVVSVLVVFAPPWRPQPVFARHLSYFNELAGGPLNAHRFLADSNLDWGQDLPALKEWVERVAGDDPINLNFFGGADPRYYSISHRNLGFGFAPVEPLSRVIRPGFLVVSATHLSGVTYEEQDRQMWSKLLATADPLGRIKYSLFVYRLR